MADVLVAVLELDGEPGFLAVDADEIYTLVGEVRESGDPEAFRISFGYRSQSWLDALPEFVGW